MMSLAAENARPGADSPFHRAAPCLASGVSLVTYGEGSGSVGQIAISVAAFSADPPTLLVCLGRVAGHAGPELGERFGVSVLAAGQAEVAERFSMRRAAPDAGRFAEENWVSTRGGASVLSDAAAVFECEVEDVIDRHGQSILIARVRWASPVEPGGALVRWRGGFDQVGWSAEQISRATGATMQAPQTAPKVRLVSAQASAGAV